MSSPRRRRPESARPAPGPGTDPGRGRQLAVPVLAAATVVAIAALTVGLLTGDLPIIQRVASGGGGDGPAKTPTPPNVVVVDPRSRVPGTILYVKAGNIWSQSGTAAHQLTTTGRDAMPAWAPDGASIYYVATADQAGSFPYQGSLRKYSLSVPSLVRSSPEPTGAPQVVLTGLWQSGRYTLSYFLRQPAVSPDGTKIAVVSDGPDPTKSDVVLQLVDMATGKLTSLTLPETAPLGHQDPAWRPDGAVLAYVRPGRDGTRGESTIWRYDVKTKKAVALTGPGYLSPAWSPSGKFLAATRSDSFGTDVVILDAGTGIEMLRVTSDGRSFSPTWSPAEDAVAFLRVDGGVVDLVEVPVRYVGSTWAPGSTLALTEAAGLDAASRPAWFIPPDQLPTPAASPAASPAAPTSTPRPSATTRATATPRPSR